jgi:hypothetical protein
MTKETRNSAQEILDDLCDYTSVVYDGGGPEPEHLEVTDVHIVPSGAALGIGPIDSAETLRRICETGLVMYGETDDIHSLDVDGVMVTSSGVDVLVCLPGVSRHALQAFASGDIDASEFKKLLTDGEETEQTGPDVLPAEYFGDAWSDDGEVLSIGELRVPVEAMAQPVSVYVHRYAADGAVAGILIDSHCHSCHEKGAEEAEAYRVMDAGA